MPSWHSILLKQPLAECFRVFNNPAKILQWTLLQSLNSKSSFCAVPITVSMPSWQSIKNPQMILSLTTEFFFCALLCTECPPGRALQFFNRVLCALLALLNAHLAELYRTPQRFCLQLCFSTALPPEVFNNLKGLPLS
jgi:hypothetical protein